VKSGKFDTFTGKPTISKYGSVLFSFQHNTTVMTKLKSNVGFINILKF